MYGISVLVHLGARRIVKDAVRVVALCCTAGLAGCSDEGTEASGVAGTAGRAAAAGRGGSSVASAGHAGRTPAANGGVVADGGRGGDSTASAAPRDADAGAAEAQGFVIALSTATCPEGCPTYDLKLDASGAVEFNGRGNTRQQGWSGKSVSPEVAAEVLQAFRAASYWQLGAAYRTTEDGCVTVAGDRATYTWNVTTDSRSKIVVDYLGCTGVPALEALRRIPGQLREKLALDNWIGF